MKIEIEIPDAVSDCENHRFDGTTGFCKCGLHMSLWRFLKPKEESNCA